MKLFAVLLSIGLLLGLAGCDCCKPRVATCPPQTTDICDVCPSAAVTTGDVCPTCPPAATGSCPTCPSNGQLGEFGGPATQPGATTNGLRSNSSY